MLPEGSRLYSPKYWAEIIASIRRFKTSDGKRAPYKPLLLLWLIGKIVNDKENAFPFAETRSELGNLLSFYRVGTTDPKPEDPFFRLMSTPEIWLVEDNTGQRITKFPSSMAVRDQSIGRLTSRFKSALYIPEVRDEIVNELLNAEFPVSQHESILNKVDLRGYIRLTPRVRDPNFMKQVRRAYDFCCSFCSFSARLHGELVGLEAAHIRMHAQGGPDALRNGILLCAQHHSFFDDGALGLKIVRGEYRILVSQDLQDMSGADLVSLSGKRIRLPQKGYEPPGEEHIEWHYMNLFKRPERQLV